MAKTTMIHARIEPELKNQVEQLFQKLGLSTTQAISLFFRRALNHQGLPFEIRLPNKTSMKTFKSTDAGKGITYAKNAEDLFKKLGI